MDRKSRKIDLPKTTKYCTSLGIFSEYLIIMSKNFSIPKFNYRRSFYRNFMQLISQPTALEAHFYTWNSDTVETEDEFKERQRLVRRQRFSNGFTGPTISHPSRCRLDMGRYRRCFSDGGSRNVRGQLALQLTMLRGRPDGIALLLTEIITEWVCLRRANRSQICARLGEKVSQAEVFSVDSVECSNISASFMSHMYLWQTAPIHWSMALFFRSHAPRKPATMESYLTENRCGRNSLLGHSCSIANAVHRLKKSCQNEPRQVVLLAAEFISIAFYTNETQKFRLDFWQ
ncbi:hypothetical protein T06_16303 [Trichinella sp. T6]|nr:hypothetical protein T06_16303 [Trichinella sp. T6]